MDWTIYFLQGIELLFLGIGTYLDVRDRELPVLFLAIFFLLGICCNVLWKYQSLKNVMLGGLAGGIFLAIGWATKEAIGYGDGIGILILGIFEGFKDVMVILAGAFLLSGIYGIWSLLGLKKAKQDTMPFFPFLFLAFMGAMLL